MEADLPEPNIEDLEARIKELSEEDIKTVDLSEYQYIFSDANKIKKQSDAQYEIYIDLSINILENKEDSAYSEAKHIVANHYHIPVPSGQEYDTYLNAFIEYFHNCMSSGANNNTNNREQQ